MTRDRQFQVEHPTGVESIMSPIRCLMALIMISADDHTRLDHSSSTINSKRRHGLVVGPFSGWSWAGPSHTGQSALVNLNAATPLHPISRAAPRRRCNRGSVSRVRPLCQCSGLCHDRDRRAEALLAPQAGRHSLSSREAVPQPSAVHHCNALDSEERGPTSTTGVSGTACRLAAEGLRPWAGTADVTLPREDGRLDRLSRCCEAFRRGDRRAARMTASGGPSGGQVEGVFVCAHAAASRHMRFSSR